MALLYEKKRAWEKIAPLMRTHNNKKKNYPHTKSRFFNQPKAIEM